MLIFSVQYDQLWSSCCIECNNTLFKIYIHYHDITLGICEILAHQRFITNWSRQLTNCIVVSSLWFDWEQNLLHILIQTNHGSDDLYFVDIMQNPIWKVISITSSIIKFLGSKKKWEWDIRLYTKLRLDFSIDIKYDSESSISTVLHHWTFFSNDSNLSRSLYKEFSSTRIDIESLWHNWEDDRNAQSIRINVMTTKKRTKCLAQVYG